MTLPGVTVALPVYRDPGTLPQAIACVQAQTLSDLDILLVLNGSDAATRALAGDFARRDSRIRIIELPEANLAAACNTALEAARHDLVARMDADDLCPPARLALQAAYMQAHPEVAALGCAWELLDSHDRIIATVRPPADPQVLRWRLLLGNVLAHGSMMLRRLPVLKAGGYDTRCGRAQDYQLWLRLSRGWDIAALPEVLYQHRTRFAEDPGRSSAAQAAIAAPAMLEAWRELPGADQHQLERLSTALEHAISREQGADALPIESLLNECPTREALLAWLWRQWNTPPLPRQAAELCRRARLREIGGELRAAGVCEVWLWGAGDHTRWLLHHRADLGISIAGLTDDALAGQQRYGFTIIAPDALDAEACVLISSDWHEEAIWKRSEPVRRRGVRVARLYESPSAEAWR